METNLDDNTGDKKCTCSENYYDEHTCPYQADVNNDSERMCTCCLYCIERCCDDI